MSIKKQIEELQGKLERAQADIEYIEGFSTLTQDQIENLNRLYDFEMRLEQRIKILYRKSYRSRKCNRVNKNTQQLIESNTI